MIANLVFIMLYILRLLLHSFTYLFMCCFFFSLYAHTSYILYTIFYFYFTLRCHDTFCLKCFRNTGCQSLSCHELFSCKNFQEFMLGLYFIVFNKWVWVEWFMTSLICSFCLLWFCHRLLNGEIVRTYVNHVRNICHLGCV